MDEYTEIEKSLIEKISDNDLRDSLSLLRKSTEDIWSTDAPRIIRDFTDHGLNHSLRLIKNASKLLDANKGIALSDEELYLLIAGIYLHDIGMQCDVNKYPEIKEKAVDFGANFNIDFASETSSNFTLAEQKEIRKNHHFLSSAWIDYAHHFTGTFLDKSIKSIPDELLKDLIDICKYHSSLNIADCAVKFEIKKHGRKQLVAALVRFSDELDIDKNRVTIETVKNFSINPINAFYWWLHQLTIIEIGDGNLNITIRLKHDDFNSFGSFIKRTYLDEFRKKNNPVIEILNSNNINIAINANSDVIEYEYASKLPDEIVKVIQEMQVEVIVDKGISIPGTKQLPNNQLNNYPKPKPYFAGREAELKVLNDAFGKSPFIFIEGGGGIGKTQFVAKFIEDQEINDKVVWYECIPTSLPDDIIKGSGFEELLKGKEKTEREKFSAFKDKIEEYDLVVFLDNYQEVENIPAFKAFLDFVNDYLRKGHLIILGRDNIISAILQPKRIPIKGLGEDSLLHAQKLIEQSYPDLIKTPTEELKKLCNTLKGYPLAVDLAIYLLSLNVPVDNILNAAVTEAQSEGSEIEKISNRLLNEIFTRPDASEDEKEFLKLFSIFRGKIQLDEAKSVIPVAIFEKASRKLIIRNLLEFNDDYLELHPLIREFCYDELINKKETHHKAAQYNIEKRSDKWNPEIEEKVFYHLSCSEQWTDIADTIIKSGREFILHGYLDRLQQMITFTKQQNIFEPKFDIYEGDIAEIKGNWDTALTLFEKAKQSSNEEVRIEGMIKYGEMLFRKGDVKLAQTFFDDAIATTKGITYKKWNANALNDLGLVSAFFGKCDEALVLLNDALIIREGLENKEDIASTLFNISSIKQTIGENCDALYLNEKSLRISEEIDDKSNISRCLNDKGFIKANLGLITEALELYEKSLKVSEEIGEKSSIAATLNNIGLIKADLGFKKEALELFEKSLKIVEEIGDKSRIAKGLNNIGYIKAELGLRKKAIDYYERSLKIREEIGDKSGVANSLLNIGSSKDNLGFKRDALKLYERSLEIYVEIGEKSGIAVCLNNIGGIKSELGFKDEALELYEKSVSLIEEIGNKSDAANSLKNIGALLFENNGDLVKSCFCLLKSYALYLQMGMPDKKDPIDFLYQMRKKLGNLKFKILVLKALQQLNEELKNLINLSELLGEPIKVEKTPGRNEPCYCGNGKKYKHCHGK